MNSQYLADALSAMQAAPSQPTGAPVPQALRQQGRGQAAQDPGRLNLAEAVRGAGSAIAGAPAAIAKVPANLAGIFRLGGA